VKICTDQNQKRDLERENVELFRYATEMQFLLKDLAPVRWTLSVRSVIGTGTAFQGKSDYDTQLLSHLATLYVTFFFLRVIPLGRYRVMMRRDGTYRFLGRARLRLADKFVLSIAVVVPLVLTILLILSALRYFS
jgi:hypothetical protein